MYQPAPRYPKYPSRHIPTRSRSKWKRWLILGIAILCLLVIAVGVLWNWARSDMSNYVGLKNARVALVQINSTRIPHLMSVQLTIFITDNEPPKMINCYIMQGENLILQGDILNFTSWLNGVGLHSGFKLTQVAGCYSNAMFKDKLTLSNLNGGEDSFFRAVQGEKWYSGLVEAQHSKPITLLANLPVGKKSETYNVFTSPKGLYVAASK